MSRKAEPRSRSGRSLTDEERAASGIGRITLRLHVSALDRIEALAERRGCSRAEAVDEAVREALERGPVGYVTVILPEEDRVEYVRADTVDALRAFAERAVAALRDQEWHGEECAACGADENASVRTHRPDCARVALLRDAAEVLK